MGVPGCAAQVAVRGASLVLHLGADVAAVSAVDADGEGAAGPAAVAVQDGVGAQFAGQEDDIVGGREAGQDRAERGADAAELIRGAGEGLRPGRRPLLTGDARTSRAP